MNSIKTRAVALAVIGVISGLLWLSRAGGAQSPTAACTVPGTHGTIQAALDDLGCDAISLTAASYTESVIVSRSLTLTGAPSVLAGLLTITEDGTEAQVEGIELAAGMLFQDDFELGDATKWSEVSQ